MKIFYKPNRDNELEKVTHNSTGFSFVRVERILTRHTRAAILFFTLIPLPARPYFSRGCGGRAIRSKNACLMLGVLYMGIALINRYRAFIKNALLEVFQQGKNALITNRR
ncbi:hypothetical protein DDO02_00915 [Vibrio cholerae]|nr:hypothetical protein [Vibrio cholerae]